MLSAAQVGQSIRIAGRGARLTKLDMKDAYKHIDISANGGQA
jgi:hypothetical protein